MTPGTGLASLLRRFIFPRASGPAEAGSRRRSFILLLLSFLLVSLDVSGQETAPPHTITVVTDDNFPPYVFRDNEGRLQGIIIDQWRVWEKRTGVTAEIHGMDWNDAVRRMKEGEFDVIDAMFKTPERTA